MKKITLLAVAFLFAVAAQAQETSFEVDQGYEVGEIVGQNEWILESENPAHSSLFLVSDEDASDGEQSLKYTADENNVLLDGGALISTPIDIGNPDVYELSFEFKVIEDGDNSGQISIGLDDGTAYMSRAVIGVFETAEGEVPVAGFVNEEDLVDGNILEFDEFYTFKMKLDFTQQMVEYYVEDEFLGTMPGLSAIPNNLTTINFGGNTFYVDNFVVDGDMSVEDFDTAEFTHFTQDNQLFLNSDVQIGEVAIFNLLGQQVISENVNDISGNIDLGSLNAGVYMTKVSVNGQTKSFKFIKN